MKVVCHTPGAATLMVMTLQEQIRSNRIRTAVLVLMFLAFTAALGLILALAFDPGILTVVGVIAIGYGLVSWFGAGRMVAGLTGAKPVGRDAYPEVRALLEEVSIGAGLDRTPPLYVIDDPAPNAFAAGQDPARAYVAVTTGLLAVMDRRELRAVLAHEVAHVRNRDVRLMTLAAVLAGVVLIVGDLLLQAMWFGGGDEDASPIAAILGLVALILAPLGMAMLQGALSRRREYLADAAAAEITGDIEGMARALAVLEIDPRHLRHTGKATAHMYIESPLRTERGARGSWGGLFATHPPTDARIAALEEAGGFMLDREAIAREWAARMPDLV